MEQDPIKPADQVLALATALTQVYKRSCAAAIREADRQRQTDMGKQLVGALYLIAMVGLIVGIDVAFFRHRFWERLIVSVGIVLVFAAFYLRFFRAWNSR